MEKLIEALRSGSYRIDACRAVGIHYNTLLAWEKKGESAEIGGICRVFGCPAEGRGRSRHNKLEVITKAAQEGDWRAAAWFLEHKYPDKWARVEKRADQVQPFTIVFSREVKDV